MMDTVRMSYFCPKYEGEIYDFVSSCGVCQEVRRLNYKPPPMMSHADLSLKLGYRLVCNWAEQDGHNIHIMVDSVSGFLWPKEYPLKGTNESLQHLSEVIMFMGRFGEVHSNNGPSYRTQWDKELAKQGMDAVHGAAYHAQSQGLAETNVNRGKTMVRKLGYLRGGKFQVGTQDEPFTHNFDLILTGNHFTVDQPLPNGPNLGAKALGVFGFADMHGSDVGTSWTKLAATAAAGDTTLELSEAVTWASGSEIVIDRKSTRLNSSHSSVSRMPSSA